MVCLASVSRAATTLRMPSLGDELVAALGIEREHLLLGHARRRAPPPAAGARGRGGLQRHLAGLCGLDVGLHHAAMRAGAGDGGQLDAGVLGEASRQRRGEDARAPLDLPPPPPEPLPTIGAAADPVTAVGIAPRRRSLQSAAAAGAGAALAPPQAALGRLGRRRRCGSRRSVAALALLQDHRDHRVDLHVLGALGDDDLADLALVDRLDFHRRLVGLDLGDHVAGGDGVALLDVPLGELALLHRGRERGHGDVDAHGLLADVLVPELPDASR